jgi:hypothetical protein
MKVFKYRNRLTNIIIPVTACISIFCFTPILFYSVFIITIPLLGIAVGVLYFYQKMTFKIIIEDDKIVIGKNSIKWERIEKGIIVRQYSNENRNAKKNDSISLLYCDENNDRKTITITPGKMENTKELKRLISEKIQVVKLKDMNNA